MAEKKDVERRGAGKQRNLLSGYDFLLFEPALVLGPRKRNGRFLLQDLPEFRWKSSTSFVRVERSTFLLPRHLLLPTHIDQNSLLRRKEAGTRLSVPEFLKKKNKIIPSPSKREL